MVRPASRGARQRGQSRGFSGSGEGRPGRECCQPTPVVCCPQRHEGGETFRRSALESFAGRPARSPSRPSARPHVSRDFSANWAGRPSFLGASRPTWRSDSTSTTLL